MLAALKQHWPEYLMEAAELAILVLALCCVTVALEYPASPLHRAIPDPVLRRLLKGLTIGLVALGIIYSPWGKQSGAHLNPSITFTYFRLRKVPGWDALGYILAHFAGAIVGILLAALVLRDRLSDPAVHSVTTLPGMAGPAVAFLAELLISFLLMLVILTVSNAEMLARLTGLCAVTLMATCILLETPLSGMSMNPARSFAAALLGQMWAWLWLYFLAPPLGMLLAAQVYVWLRGPDAVICAKLHHHNNKRCIFHCGYRAREEQQRAAALSRQPR